MKKDNLEVNEEGYYVFKDTKNLYHIWVAKQKYKVKALGDRVVHHVDGNKLNNHYDNLILLSKEDHFTLHKYQKYLEEYEELLEQYGDKYTIEPWAILLLLITSAITGLPIADAIVSISLAVFAILFGIKKDGIRIWAHFLGKRAEEEKSL